LIFINEGYKIPTYAPVLGIYPYP